MRGRPIDDGLVPEASPYAYDAFASYATDPDRDLVRALEGFVEGFHRRPSLSVELRRELELCVDGRDFVVPRRTRKATAPRAIGDIVEAYMRRSRSLLVMCGPASRSHPWIDHEIRWWIAHRPNDPIYFALTHGETTEASQAMPPALLDAGGGDLPIFFDLRGFYGPGRWIGGFGVGRSAVGPDRRQWRSVRPFREEAVKVAARLLSDALGGTLSVEDVEAAFVEVERRSARRRLVAVALGGVAVATAVAWGAHSLVVADRARLEATTEGHLQRSRLLADQGGAALPIALAHAASAYAARPDAPAISAAFAAMQELVPIERVMRPDGGEPAWAVRFVGQGRFMLVGGRSGVLRLVEVASGEVRARIDLRASAIRQIAYEQVSGDVFVGADRGLVRLHAALDDAEHGHRLIETGRALDGSRIGALVVDRRRERVLAGLLTNGELWSFPLAADAQLNGTRQTTVTDPRYAEDGTSDVPSGIYGLATAGERIVVSCIDGVVSIFPAGDLKAPFRQFVHPHPIFAMAATHDGRDVIVADDQGGLGIYDVASAALRRADTGPVRTSGIARDLEGRLSSSPADRLPNVGLAIDPDDQILAVTSHDRSVRFLSFVDLSPLGFAIHRAAPRAVDFDPLGRAAIVADDGAIQIVRPLGQPEISRISGVAGFVPFPDGRIVAWPIVAPTVPGSRRPPAGSVRRRIVLVDPRDGAMSGLGSAQGDVWEATSSADRVVYRSANSSEMHVLTPTGKPPCTSLKHRNEPGDVDFVQQMLPGPDPGTLATITKRSESEARTLHVWDLSTCAIRLSLPTTGLAAVAKGALVTVENGNRVAILTPPYADAHAITFSSPPTAVGVGDGGRSVMVAIAAEHAVCLCEPGRHPDPGLACHGASERYACRSVDALRDGPQGPEVPVSLRFDPASDVAIAQHRSAVLLMGTRASGWSFNPVSPEQLRPVTPPFAFHEGQRLLAVPAGETGTRLLSLDTGQALAEFPTAGRVRLIGFTGGSKPYLVTLDGAMLRVWSWAPADIVGRICERWNPELDVEDARTTSHVATRDEFCGSGSRAAIVTPVPVVRRHHHAADDDRGVPR